MYDCAYLRAHSVSANIDELGYQKDADATMKAGDTVKILYYGGCATDGCSAEGMGMGMGMLRCRAVLVGVATALIAALQCCTDFCWRSPSA